MLKLGFASVQALQDWLNKNRCGCTGPEEYDKWLQDFFDRGNIVSVCGEEYDYWACWELL